MALSSRHREEGERDTAPRLFLFEPVLAPEKKRAFYVKAMRGQEHIVRMHNFFCNQWFQSGDTSGEGRSMRASTVFPICVEGKSESGQTAFD